MPQYGFFFDQSRCAGCKTCSVACKEWNGLPPGPLKYCRVYEYEKGSFPNVRLHCMWIPCFHCEKPGCVTACKQGAISKENKFGAVLIDESKCIGCRLCSRGCPYGAIVYESDAKKVKAQKCSMCIERIERGDHPICVLSCTMRALDFGPMSELVEKFGKLKDLEDLPNSEITSPAVVFKPHSEKRQLVPYDVDRALELLAKRDPLPQIYTSTADVTDIPEGVVGRSKLVIKHDSTDDLMRYTRNDEG